jgi:exonuclease III
MTGIVTLNVNGLNSLIKRYRMMSCIKKQKPIICCLQEMCLIDEDRHWFRVKEWKKIFQAGAATLI